MGNAAEIVGKVQPDLSIKVYQAVDFGSNIGGCQKAVGQGWMCQCLHGD